MRHLVSLILMVMLVLPMGSASAQDLSGFSKAQRADILRFAVNNSLFTLYHEVSHLLIDKLGLPVLGKEEDAADSMATWMLLDKGTPDANQALEDATKGWVLTGESFGDRFTQDDYLSGYSPDRHRAMQIVCLMVGADGAAFRPVANAYSMSPQRQHSCNFEYELVDRSVSGLLSEPGTGTRVRVVYHDGGPDLRLAERVFRYSEIFEDVAEEVRRGYRLDGRVKFTARRCGEANAFYDTNSTEIIFCYELMEDFIGLYADDLRRDSGRRSAPGRD